MSSSDTQNPPPPETQLEDIITPNYTSDSESEPDSESDEGMTIKLTEIKTLNQLYKQGVLSATSNIKAKCDKSLLDRISLIQGDITRLQVDSIVNAANTRLLGGGGVDGAIHRAAGPRLVKECRTLNGCGTGDAKITKGYKLPSSHVIHTVGPIYSESDVQEKAALLRSCYQTSLQVAVANSLKHIVFPCISTGIYGYPIQDATRIALDTVRHFMEGDSEASKALERVVFVVFPDEDRDVYQELLPEYFPPEEEQPQVPATGEEVPKSDSNSDEVGIPPSSR